MVRILLFLLKCLVGLLASIGFLIVLGAGALGFLAVKSERLRSMDAEVPQQTVLRLDLSKGILEAQPDNPLARAAMGEPPDILSTLQGLEEAATDQRVGGLFLRLGQGRIGMAQVQELRAAVARFRESGKPVVAFAETFGEGGNAMLHYYLASAADTIWLQPSGRLQITGYAVESPFLKEALDEIGVEAQLSERKEYKGAMSPLTEERMPDPQRRNLQVLVDSWLSQWVEDVAERRELQSADLRALIDRAPLSAQEGNALGLVDNLGYIDEVADAVLDEAEFLDVGSYAQVATDNEGTQAEATVALIYGLGPVVLGEGQNDPVFGTVSLGSRDVSLAIAEALEDPDVDAILLRVDSPGGSYVASDAVWRQVNRAREMEVPVVVSMGNIAASGGYFLSAPAGHIIAQAGTVTGSVGVVGGKIVLEELWSKLSISWDGVAAGRRATLWSSNRGFDEEEWRVLERSLDETYADFTSKVAAGRNLSPEAVENAAKGQVWSGTDAVAMGLVDRLGGYHEAQEIIRESLGLEPDAALAFAPFPEPRDPWRAVLESLFSGRFASDGFTSFARSLAGAMRVLNALEDGLRVLSGDGRVEELSADPVRPR